MSRLGVVRWLEVGGNITTNSSISPFSPATKDEWLQADALISVCFIAVLLIHAHLCSLTKVGMSTLFTLVSLIIALLLAPVVGAVLLVCSLYRHMVSSVLKVVVGPRYHGLLDGTDAFWAIEDDTSLSVINVLALADFSFIVSASAQDEPLQTITDLIQERLLAPDSPFPKLMCFRRLSRLGYYYWEKQESISIADHIHWMDIEDQGDKTITETCLKNFVSSLMNTSLPANHAAGWEILVGRYPIKPSSDLLDAMENGGWTTKSCAGIRYPVLFRVHHSIGDGVALVNLLLDSLADPSSRSGTPIPCLRSSSPSFNRNFVRPKTPTIEEEPEDSPVIALWQESDTIPKCTKSQSCDFNSICLNISSETGSMLKKSSTYDFGEYNSTFSNKNYNTSELKSNVRAACAKFLNIINDPNDLKITLSERKIKDFEVVVNNRPSGEFLDLMNNATKLESQFENKMVQKRNNQYKHMLRKSTAIICLTFSFLCKLVGSLKSLACQWSVLLFAPASLLNQALSQTQDVNLLHGPRLSGHKVVAWYFEQQDNADQLLMSMIKRIRAKTGVRFSDVLLTALSGSLESYYNQCNEVPEYITVVIPARLGPPPNITANFVKSGKLSTKVACTDKNVEDKLENKFSVAMLPLPIANQSSSKVKLFTKLRQVRHHCDQLRNSPDFLVNYWLLRVVATLLPTPLLRPLVSSSHCTLVLSNLPGPNRLTQLAGHTLHDLVFWVPNRTTTGVGVTVLSYAGRLQLGLMADRALIACQQDAQLILDGIASAIHHMDQVSSA